MAKDREIIAVPLCLGIIPKDWSADNIYIYIKKEFNGYVYDFSVGLMLLMLMITLTFIDI